MQSLKGTVHPQNLAISLFAFIWAFYYVCTEPIVYQFFSPYWMSILSLGLYFTFQFPLSLYFYFAFEHYKKLMLPAAVFHGGFAMMAVGLQAAGIFDFPRLLNINNIMLVGLIYTVILTCAEAWKKNRPMMLYAPFMIIAYISMLYNFKVFYSRSGVVSYSYRDTYFLLILCVLIYNIGQFFRKYYQSVSDREILALQNRQARENYRQMKNHLNQLGGLKHEIKNHTAALWLFIKEGQYKEAESYLEHYTSYVVPIAETIYHENFLINAAVGSLTQRAEGYGIKVDLNLKSSPVRIEDHDLYSLLSNITENALEACAAMPEGKERFIRLSLTRREPYLNIRCENTRSGEIISVDDRIQTSKSANGHGYGLWTIRRIVDSYNGIMNIEYDEETFILTLALKD
jgi:hypothetical protein